MVYLKVAHIAFFWSVLSLLFFLFCLLFFAVVVLFLSSSPGLSYSFSSSSFSSFAVLPLFLSWHFSLLIFFFLFCLLFLAGVLLFLSSFPSLSDSFCSSFVSSFSFSRSSVSLFFSWPFLILPFLSPLFCSRPLLPVSFSCSYALVSSSFLVSSFLQSSPCSCLLPLAFLTPFLPSPFQSPLFCSPSVPIFFS